MKKYSLGLLLTLLFTSYTQNILFAASTGQLGVSATILEHCKIDFSNGSADYFEKCNSIDGVDHMNAKNVIGELSAVDSYADPYFLDRDPDSQEKVKTPVELLSKKKSKVVTIVY